MNRIYLIFFIFLISCNDLRETSVDFLEPQPSGIKNAISFHKKYQGTYWNPADSSKLEISTDKIIRTSSFSFQCSINELDSSYQANKSDTNKIRIELAKDLVNVIRFKNDSMEGIWIMKDTIFSISENNICRLYNGAYFLNQTYDNFTWKVQRMDLHKKQLTFGIIEPNDSLFATNPVKDTEVIKNDSGMVVNYKINPTKPELKNLINSGAFTSEGEVWIKQY